MSDDPTNFFLKNGYVSGIDVLDENEVIELKRNFQVFEDDIGRNDAQYSLHNVHLQHPWVLNLASHPRILEPLRKILGENLILLDSRFIVKYPERTLEAENGVKPYVAWHQDCRYWGVAGDVVSVWLAVDDADKDNGCMCVIPGTHTSGLLEHNQATIWGNLLTSNQEISERLFDAGRSVLCQLRAGQISLHHGHLIHGSESNRSDRRRCGFVVRYVATSCCPVEDPDRPRKFMATVLVAGRDEHNNFVDNAPVWFRKAPAEGP